MKKNNGLITAALIGLGIYILSNNNSTNAANTPSQQQISSAANTYTSTPLGSSLNTTAKNTLLTNANNLQAQGVNNAQIVNMLTRALSSGSYTPAISQNTNSGFTNNTAPTVNPITSQSGTSAVIIANGYNNNTGKGSSLEATFTNASVNHTVNAPQNSIVTPNGKGGFNIVLQ